jgi:hypothetical protein
MLDREWKRIFIEGMTPTGGSTCGDIHPTGDKGWSAEATARGWSSPLVSASAGTKLIRW